MKPTHQKRRATTALLLLLTFLSGLSLVSCADLLTPSSRRPHVTVDEFLVKTENRDGAGQTIDVLPGIVGVPEEVSGNVVITASEENGGIVRRAYSMTTGKLLVTADPGGQGGFISSFLENPEEAEGVFYLLSNDIIRIYNADGSEAISSFWDDSPEQLPVTDALNGFSFNGVEYYVKDGSVVFDGYNPLENDYFAASEEFGGRYYYLSEEMVFVFDETGALLYDYSLPSYADDAHIFVLGNGNLFIQYTYGALEGEEYDFVRGSGKFKIVSFLYNLDRNAKTELTLSYLVTQLENSFTDPDFYDKYTSRVANLALISEVSDKRIDENRSARYIVLSDNLVELFALSDVAQGAREITRISNDRYLVHTAAGTLLVDGNSLLVGQLNNYRWISEKYIVTAGHIYNHDLEVIFDMTEDSYTFFSGVGDNLLLSKVIDETAGLYLFREGEEPRYVCDVSNYRECYAGYAVQNGSAYRYYDEDGTLLAETAGLINWIYTDTEDGITTAVGYASDSKGRVTYYRLSYQEAPQHFYVEPR